MFTSEDYKKSVAIINDNNLPDDQRLNALKELSKSVNERKDPYTRSYKDYYVEPTPATPASREFSYDGYDRIPAKPAQAGYWASEAVRIHHPEIEAENRQLQTLASNFEQDEQLLSTIADFIQRGVLVNGSGLELSNTAKTTVWQKLNHMNSTKDLTSYTQLEKSSQYYIIDAASQATITALKQSAAQSAAEKAASDIAAAATLAEQKFSVNAAIIENTGKDQLSTPECMTALAEIANYLAKKPGEDDYYTTEYDYYEEEDWVYADDEAAGGHYETSRVYTRFATPEALEIKRINTESVVKANALFERPIMAQLVTMKKLKPEDRQITDFLNEAYVNKALKTYEAKNFLNYNTINDINALSIKDIEPKVYLKAMADALAKSATTDLTPKAKAFYAQLKGEELPNRQDKNYFSMCLIDNLKAINYNDHKDNAALAIIDEKRPGKTSWMRTKTHSTGLYKNDPVIKEMINAAARDTKASSTMKILESEKPTTPPATSCLGNNSQGFPAATTLGDQAIQMVTTDKKIGN